MNNRATVLVDAKGTEKETKAKPSATEQLLQCCSPDKNWEKMLKE